MRLQLTAALLALAASTAAAQDGLSVAADTLVYDDTDNVTVVSPQVSVHQELDEDGGEVSARAVVDVISAASVDVVSHATSSFEEVRTEAVLSIAKAWDDHLPSFSYRFSIEPDWESHGVTAGWQSRLGTPDSVLTASYSVTSDTIGRSETPFESWSRSLVTHGGSVGLTQVISPRLLVRGVYTLTVQDGYLEKPYRYVPLFDADAVERARASGDALDLHTFGAYRLSARPPEEVPDQRVGHALGVRGLWSLGSAGALKLDYQIYADSWDLLAHALEPELRLRLTDDLQLHVYARGYLQSAAFFWQRVYVVSQSDRIPRFRTLDRELSSYVSLTGGARVEWRHGPVAAYAEGSVMATWWDDFLLLDDRLALVGQAGVRWTP